MIEQILEAGFGARRATSMLSRVTSYSEIKSFEHLRQVDPLTIANYLRNEHPQTVGVLISKRPSPPSRRKARSTAMRN